MREAPKFVQYFMKKLGGGGNHKKGKVWGGNDDQGSVYVFNFFFNNISIPVQTIWYLLNNWDTILIL